MVSGGEAAAKHAADGNKIAYARSSSGEHTGAGGTTEQGEGCNKTSAVSGEIASNERHAVTASIGGEAAIKTLQPIDAHSGIQS
jgi:hypothetical protein